MIFGVMVLMFDVAVTFRSPEPLSQIALGHLPTAIILFVTILASGSIAAVSFRPQLSDPIILYASPVGNAGNTTRVLPVAVPEYTSESSGLKTSMVNGLIPFTN